MCTVYDRVVHLHNMTAIRKITLNGLVKNNFQSLSIWSILSVNCTALCDLYTYRLTSAHNICIYSITKWISKQ